MFDFPLHSEFGLKFRNIGVFERTLHEWMEVNEAISSVKLSKICLTED